MLLCGDEMRCIILNKKGSRHIDWFKDQKQKNRSQYLRKNLVNCLQNIKKEYTKENNKNGGRGYAVSVYGQKL